MMPKGWRETVVSLGILAWGLATTIPVPAQTPAEQGPNLPALARPPKMSGPWLASPQGVPTPCPQPGCGISHTASGAGLNLKQLVRMDPCELEQLYARGCLAPIPSGKIRGQAILDPGTKLSVPKSLGSRFVWQGKIFHSDGRTAVNRFFGIRMIKADVYNAASWRDGRPALILDYSQTSLLYAPYRDEIRQIAPGLYLGLMFDRNTCPPRLKMYFALECQPHG
jgi:hypothetical protein